MVFVSGGVEEMGSIVSFAEWLGPKKLLGSGNLLEEYFRNISVHWVLHILSNKSTCKTAVQQHLFKKVAQGV